MMSLMNVLSLSRGCPAAARGEGQEIRWGGSSEHNTQKQRGKSFSLHGQTRFQLPPTSPGDHQQQAGAQRVSQSQLS